MTVTVKSHTRIYWQVYEWNATDFTGATLRDAIRVLNIGPNPWSGYGWMWTHNHADAIDFVVQNLPEDLVFEDQSACDKWWSTWPSSHVDLDHIIRKGDVISCLPIHSEVPQPPVKIRRYQIWWCQLKLWWGYHHG